MSPRSRHTETANALVVRACLRLPFHFAFTCPFARAGERAAFILTATLLPLRPPDRQCIDPLIRLYAIYRYLPARPA